MTDDDESIIGMVCGQCGEGVLVSPEDAGIESDDEFCDGNVVWHGSQVRAVCESCGAHVLLEEEEG